MSPNQSASLHENFTIKTSCRREPFVLLLILFTHFFASYQPVFGQAPSSQKNAEAPRSSVSGSGETSTFRSVSHAFPTATSQSAIRQSRIQHPLIPVASSEKLVWGSERTNQIVCSIETPDVTWLGTGFGIKRLDNREKTVRHYTTLDGLPHNWIKCLGFYEGGLYCCTQGDMPRNEIGAWRDFKDYRTSIKLSRFVAVKDRWETVAENTLSNSQYSCVIENGMSLIVGQGEPGKLIALVTPLKGGALQSFVCPSYATKPFRVSFAHADADNLWIGTDLGLLRFNFKTKLWDRLLPNLLIGAGCADEDGSLWLTTKKSEPFRRDDTGNTVSAFRWSVTRYFLGKPPKHFSLKEGKEFQNPYSDSFPTIMVAVNKIWVVEIRGGFSDTILVNHLPTIYSLDKFSNEIKIEVFGNSPYDDYDKIPTSFLAKASMRFLSLEFGKSQVRFPGWACTTEDDEKSEFASSSPPNVEYDQYWHIEAGKIDEDGALLSKPLLLHTKPVLLHNMGNRPIESYPFPEFKIRVHQPVSTPVKIGGKFYFISFADSFRLYSWDLKRNVTSPLPELDESLSYRKSSGMSNYEWNKLSHFRIIADGDSIWIGTGAEVVKFNPRSKKVVVWKTPAGRYIGGTSPFWMMSAHGGKAWVHGASYELLMAGDETSSDLKIIKLPKFERGDYRNEPELFAVEEGIAWFKLSNEMPPIQTKVVGYELRSREWTSSFISTSPEFNQPTSYPAWKQGPIRWFKTDQSAIGYNTSTGEWTTVSPLPSGMRTSWQKILSIDDNNVWGITPYVESIGTRKITIRHLDRKRKSWSKLEIELEKSGQATAPGVMFGEVLFTPSEIGLWAYDLKRKKKTQSPPVEASAASLGFEVRAWDKNFVWLMGRNYLEKTLLRFDLDMKSWRSFTEFGAMGSERWRGNYVADGESLWLGTDKDEYHWNAKTQIWEKVSDYIGEIKGGNTFRKVVPDGDNVWLVPEIYDFDKPTLAKNGYHTELKRLEIPLYRYHIPRRSYLPVHLTSDQTALPYSLTVSKESALLTTDMGCFRYDHKRETWEKLSAPKMPEGFPPTHPWIAYEDEKSYWFINGYSGNDLSDVLQWKK